MNVSEFIEKINAERHNFNFVGHNSYYLLLVYQSTNELSLVKNCLHDKHIDLCKQNPEKMLRYFKDFLIKNYPQNMHLLSNYTLGYYEDESHLKAKVNL